MMVRGDCAEQSPWLDFLPIRREASTLINEAGLWIGSRGYNLLIAGKLQRMPGEVPGVLPQRSARSHGDRGHGGTGKDAGER